MKARFVSVFTGSLNILSLTLSHHLDTPPISIPGSRERPIPKKVKIL
jgi:hypothetical protein